ncbi:aminodeoxychorismate synthase component I [Psychrobium sp. 1_MG-2023]|uniref:aminodeoxychorismate synthase component I n=1 Tax=Psychrobium sp. 1_MG-2023 TaxID=3062624 RepID=UPI000C34308A|nr:aminodeoxychorismate synthase component I [Psychrobium sp. 1_MG-2023]MDP2561528.1 aminodeoxychorismate synthase component I [Psychrobium sp. 1_MG-2023]PKF54991.1 aminodeoxychorismate synthase, component I [Alteromonadales bacterium alter-6D02]
MSSLVHCSSLSTSLTCRELFSTVAMHPWAMLLDSGASAHIDAKYDIMVFDPLYTLQSDDEKTLITDCKTNEQTYSYDNPFDVLEQILALAELSDEGHQLPFTGGALGHFSYDLGRHCERIDQIAAKDIDLPVMAVGIYRSGIVFNRATNEVLLTTRGTADQHQQALTQVNTLLATAKQHQSPQQFQLRGAWRNQLTREQYDNKFQQVQRHLRAGNCYQINLTQRFEANYQGDEYQAYLTLADQNNTPFSAFIRLEQGAILSVSPERFIQCHQGFVETKPIKGTRPRSQDVEHDLLLAQELRDSEKDQSENLMIVDLLRNDLGRSAKPGSVQVPKLFDIESFKNVHHLVSTVTAELSSDVTTVGLLKNAFPGGSITGAPKINAMNIIDQLEPHRRSIYCGSIGYISADNQMDTNITIRTLLCLNKTEQEKEIFCWAGGGIVADSQVDAEYQECFDKVASILPLLAGE